MNTQNSNINRPSAPFLVKLEHGGKCQACYEWMLNVAFQHPNIVKLNNMRTGVEAYTLEERFELIGKQPIFWLQERFGLHGYEWNGLLLFSVQDKTKMRGRIKELKEELHVVLAFDSPVSDCYYFLIDTQTDGGTNEVFQLWQDELKKRLTLILGCDIRVFHLSYYNRVLPENHYDILESDALFGASCQEPESTPGYIRIQPESVFSILRKKLLQFNQSDFATAIASRTKNSHFPVIHILKRSEREKSPDFQESNS